MLRRTSRHFFIVLGFVWLTLVAHQSPGEDDPFRLRGYYITFMRMPTMGLSEWKDAVDCLAEDRANLLILWTAGAFPSKKFPITWRYNADHKNVQQDFVRELIDYAHSKGIRVLLGFTPFAYDGTNQYPLEHPELKARKPDNQPVDLAGIHCWGYNLCPSQPESQRFMLEYVREMFFDFYPNADGLLVESSDYAICYCPQCSERYYEREFQFVQKISQDVWQKKPDAMIAVYPHYFSGRKVPGFNVTAAKLPFDPRWTLFFTPHSAHLDPDLIRNARTSISWGDAPTLGNPRRIQDQARQARQAGVSGYVPSLEAFNFVASHPEGGEPFWVGKRLKPFGLEHLPDGQMPYGQLFPRLNRLAYREFVANPDLPFDEFKKRAAKEFFGNEGAQQQVEDLLQLHECWFFERDWYWASPLLTPQFLQERARRQNWPKEKLAAYRERLDHLRRIADRYRNVTSGAEAEMGRLAGRVVEKWDAMGGGILRKPEP